MRGRATGMTEVGGWRAWWWVAREDPHLNLPPQTGEEVGGDAPAGRAHKGSPLRVHLSTGIYFHNNDGWGCGLMARVLVGDDSPPRSPPGAHKGSPLRRGGRPQGIAPTGDAPAGGVPVNPVGLRRCGSWRRAWRWVAREDPHLNLPPQTRPLHKSQLPPQSRPNYPDSHLRPSKNWRSVEGRETFMQRSRRRGKR